MLNLELNSLIENLEIIKTSNTHECPLSEICCCLSEFCLKFPVSVCHKIATSCPPIYLSIPDAAESDVVNLSGTETLLTRYSVIS